MDYGEQRIEVFLDILENASNLFFTVYNNNYNVIKSNAPDYMMHVFFALDRIELKDTPATVPDNDKIGPLVFTNSLGMSFLSDWVMKDRELYRIYNLGPIFLDDYTAKQLEIKMNQANFTIKRKREFMGIIKTIPVIPLNRFLEWGIMLRYALTGKKISPMDFIFPEPKENEEMRERWELKNRHGTYLLESQFLKYVEEGNLSYKEAGNPLRVVEDGLNLSIRDYLRKAKDTVIAAVILVSRAAIRGGIPSETAYVLCENYIQAVEAAENVDRVYEINASMTEEFVVRVHRCKESEGISPQIREACDYISMNLDKKTDIHELASRLGYTDYYFSDRFKKEVGVSVSRFATDKKIARAKELLQYSKMDILDISNALGYATQSYFGEVFRRETGMSPGQYRVSCEGNRQ